MKTRIAVIAAMSRNGIVGHQNSLPWHLPEEMKYFRRMTVGKPIIMGRKTFESLGSKPLPHRANIIISRDPKAVTDCSVVSSIEEALAIAGPCEEVMVIGGAQIYEAFLPLAHRIYLTVIHQDYPGDARFPVVDWKKWHLGAAQDYGEFTTKVFDRKEE